ncbi:D-arabinono-1,4-lactone oxidase family protein [Mycobacterium kansasii 824]|nr:D-arabinono-1,4-lactone oxidase family protein [Mycobacterium kansasii 824]
MVTAGGDILTLSEGDDYLAARVSIGALGVISQVTLRVVPLFTLHRDDELRPLADTLERLDEQVDGNDHFEFFVFPYGDTALTRTTRRSDEKPRPLPVWKRRINDYAENAALSLICRTGRQFPSAAPALNRLMTNLMSPATVQDHGWKVYASARNVKFTEMEYAIPREHAREGVQRVIDLVRRRNLPIMFPLEVRFGAPTMPSCRPRMTATPATSPCTSTPAWSSKPISAPSKRSWTNMRAVRIGVSATIRAPARFVIGIPLGIASRRSAIASTPTGSSSTTTPGGSSAPDGATNGTTCRDQSPWLATC